MVRGDWLIAETEYLPRECVATGGFLSCSGGRERALLRLGANLLESVETFRGTWNERERRMGFWAWGGGESVCFGDVAEARRGLPGSCDVDRGFVEEDMVKELVPDKVFL